MAASRSENATAVLVAWGGGDASAPDRLLPMVYEKLRELASGWFHRATPAQTLQPTALVHEAYMHLVDQTQVNWRDRTHFYAVAVTAMRQILIQHARARGRLKRGGDWHRITLSDGVAVTSDGDVDVLALDEALNLLTTLHERQARVVELRFFGSLSVEDVAEILDVSPRTVEADWRAARAWLRAKLVEGEAP